MTTRDEAAGIQYLGCGDVLADILHLTLQVPDIFVEVKGILSYAPCAKLREADAAMWAAGEEQRVLPDIYLRECRPI